MHQTLHHFISHICDISLLRDEERERRPRVPGILRPGDRWRASDTWQQQHGVHLAYLASRDTTVSSPFAPSCLLAVASSRLPLAFPTAIAGEEIITTRDSRVKNGVCGCVYARAYAFLSLARVRNVTRKSRRMM